MEDDQRRAEGEASGTEGGRSPSGVPEGWPDEGGPVKPVQLPRLTGPRPGTTLKKKPTKPRVKLTPQQRLLVLDTWNRSGLSARDFAAVVGVSKHTLYTWKKRFEEYGPEGLMEPKRKGAPRSGLSELTRRTILMIKEANPSYGCQRISDMLVRGPALSASPASVAKVLHEAGYESEEVPTKPHRPPKRFERSRANELWQTDLFTFTLKRQNRRVYLVVFMDDYSRFIVGWGLHASQTGAAVLETLRGAIASYQAPQEILTDNGTQYVTWRGKKSDFTQELNKRGIKQTVSSPRHPQTLGKVERFWGTLWRECLEKAIFIDLNDARARIGLFMDYYNFLRPHQGISDGTPLVPADRYFAAAESVKHTLRKRVKANSLEMAQKGLPKEPFYLTGQVDGKPVSVHREGDRVIVTGQGVERREVADGAPEEYGERAPGTSPLDEGLKELAESLTNGYNTEEEYHGADSQEQGQTEAEERTVERSAGVPDVGDNNHTRVEGGAVAPEGGSDFGGAGGEPASGGCGSSA